MPANSLDHPGSDDRYCLLDDLHRRYDGPPPVCERAAVLARIAGQPLSARDATLRTLEALARSTRASLAASRLRRVRVDSRRPSDALSLADDPVLIRLGGSLAEYRSMAVRIRDGRLYAKAPPTSVRAIAC